MQILLGAHETIVKINSKTVSIDYIQHFVSTHFAQRTIKNNIITIPASTQNFYHRSFLLKWLYTLYAKKTNNYHPELKERLIYRQAKTIKIVLPQKIIHEILYKVVDDKTINISIKPSNYNVAYTIKTHFQTKMILLVSGMQISLEDEEQKELLKVLMHSKDIIDIPHAHIFNKQQFNLFFKPKLTMPLEEQCYNPYTILGLSRSDTLSTIKKRYKYLAKCHHPDMAQNRDEETLQEHTRVFQSIHQAYEIVISQNKLAV